MLTPPLKNLALPLLGLALFLSACGKKSETPTEAAASSKEVKIPDEPDAAIQFILGEVAKSNGLVLWEAMPASYQDDVNGIAHLAGQKIDAEIYDKVFATVSRLAKVMDKQKEFVFNTNLGGGEKDEDELAQMRTAWPSVMDLVQTLTTSSLASAGGLKSFEGKPFFKDTVSALLADMDALTKLQLESDQPLLSDFDKAKINYLEGSDTEAILEINMPGQEAETETVVKVEDRWVPLEMAQSWTTQIAEARKQLQAIDPAKITKQKPQILGVFTMVDGVLTQIEAAETQEQFDQALQGAMMPFMAIMMMGQGMGGSETVPAMPGADNEIPEIPQGMPNLPTTPNLSEPDSSAGY